MASLVSDEGMCTHCPWLASAEQKKQKQKQNKSPAILIKSLSPLLWQLRGPRLTDVPGFGSANHLIRGTQGMCFREPIESHRSI